MHQILHLILWPFISRPKQCAKKSFNKMSKSKIGKLINKSKSCNLPIHAENQQNGTESNLDNGRKQTAELIYVIKDWFPNFRSYCS